MTKDVHERQAREAERAAYHVDGEVPAVGGIECTVLPGLERARAVVDAGGGLVAALMYGGALLVRSLDSRGPVREFRAPVRGVVCVAALGGGAVALGGEDGRVAVLDSMNGGLLWAGRVHAGRNRVRALVLHEETLYVTAGADICSVAVFGGGCVLRVVRRVRGAHGGLLVRRVSVGIKGDVVLSTGRDAAVVVWTPALKRIARLQHSVEVTCMTATRDAIVTAAADEIRIYQNGGSFALRACLRGLSPPVTLLPSADGRAVLSVARRGAWALVDATSISHTRVAGSERCYHAARTSDGRLLIAGECACYVATLPRTVSRRMRRVPLRQRLEYLHKRILPHAPTIIAATAAAAVFALFALRRRAWGNR